MMTTAHRYTTKQIAQEIGRSQKHVQFVANFHNIGVLVTPRLRMYTSDDLEAIRKLCNGQPGRRKRVA